MLELGDQPCFCCLHKSSFKNDVRRQRKIWHLAGRYVELLAEPIQATIRLEVVRACGLLDAVKAADAWAGGENSMSQVTFSFYVVMF